MTRVKEEIYKIPRDVKRETIVQDKTRAKQLEIGREMGYNMAQIGKTKLPDDGNSNQ